LRVNREPVCFGIINTCPSATDVATAANGIGNPFSPRSQDSEFEWLIRAKLIDTPPAVNFDSDTSTRIDSPLVEENALTTGIQISYFKQSDSRVIAAFTVQTDNRDLVFKDSGGAPTAHLNIWGRITTLTGRRVGFFEDTVTTTATPAELAEAKERKSSDQMRLRLAHL
jgi:hypothetical protein